MPNEREIIALIPARGGSKGIPGKNLRLLDGKPLIAHTILDAKEAKLVKRIFVSTDDPAIARISKRFDAEVIVRPKKISGDKASSESALLHALGYIEKMGIRPELVVFLQCTSPIRTGMDIDRSIKKLDRAQADSILSVVPSHRFIWEKAKNEVRSINYDYRKRQRRQDMAPQYLENGSIYVFKPWVIKKYNNRLGGRVAISKMDSWSAFEIDTFEDFEICEWIMKRFLRTKSFVNLKQLKKTKL